MTDETLQTNQRYSIHDHECPYCEESLAHPDSLDDDLSLTEVYRRHRRAHYSWSDVAEEDVEKYLATTYEEDEDTGEEVEEKTFVFTYYTEHVEEVVVTATHEDEAREEADFKRSYNGEYQQTIHTEVEEW